MVILAHTPQAKGDQEDRCARLRATGNRGDGWKHLLVQQLAAHLKDLGYQIVTRTEVRGQRVDVIASARLSRVLIRVELKPLDFAEVRRVQQSLRSANSEEFQDETLWITFDCEWVDQVPAVGIRFLEEPASGSLEVGGLHAVVDTGVLKYSHDNGVHQPTSHTVGLGQFMTQRMARQIQFLPIDATHSGWGDNRMWQLGIRQLHARVGHLRKFARVSTAKLAALATEMEAKEQQVGALGRALDREQSASAAMRSKESAAEQRLRDARQQLADLQDWASKVEAQRSSGLGRWALRGVRKPPGL